MLSKALGAPLMPWQQLIADVGLEYDPASGLPAYREVVVTVPRQSGKTTLCLAWEVDRALMWGSPQHIAYTAQTGLDARNKMTKGPKSHMAILRGSPLRVKVAKTLEGAAYTAIEWRNGSVIQAFSNAPESGHGPTLGMAVIDEAFADEDFRRDQALSPTMVTVEDAQTLTISTAGTERSVFLKRKVENGRSAVADGRTSGVAYFEWAADPDLPWDDPATWWTCMPALGHTVTERTIRAEIDKGMTENDFRRAYLNQWTVSDDRVIPSQVWSKVVHADTAPRGDLVLAVDVNPERTGASIAACDPAGNVELIDYGRVTGLVDRIADYADRHVAPVAVDAASPAGSFIAELEGRGVVVLAYQSRELANACGRFYDMVADREISVRPRDVLEKAVAGATQRTVGDAWAWGRRQATVDISPLVAVTLAVDAAVKPKEAPDPGLMVFSLDD